MTNIVNFGFEKKSNKKFIQFNSADRSLGRLSTREELIGKSQLTEALNYQKLISYLYAPIAFIPSKAGRQSIIFLDNSLRGYGIVVQYV